MAVTTDTMLGQLAGCSRVAITQSWQLAIVVDGCGRMHLVALITDTDAGAYRRVDLLTPVSGDQVDQMHVDVVHAFDVEQLAVLRGLIERHVADEQLRRELTELIVLATMNAAEPTLDEHCEAFTLARPWERRP